MKLNIQPKMMLLAILSAYASPQMALADESKTIDVEKIEVYSATPLKGIGLPLYKVPANIQLAPPKEINDQTGVSIADYMTNNMQSVTVTELGGNPWQPEINFRGYSASSLLGNPQGLSTYIDGVRVNEPFGDLTSWDKIPSFAIGNMQLIPGSNPLYGLNTLGGAIAIQTKSGRDNQGAAVEFEAGSWGRQRALVEYGGVSQDGSVDYMIGYQHTTENGWRKFSPSHVNQLFAKTGWQNETTKLDLTYIGSDNNLIGNGLTPEFLLSGDRDQINTRPDQTKNYSHMLALNGSHWFNDDTMFSGNVYYKKSNRRTVNGDGYEGEFEVDAGDTGSLEGYPNVICDNTAGVDELECEVIGSVLNRTNTKQDTYGLTGQMTFNQDFMGKENQFIVGTSYDYSLIRFKQSERVNISELSESIDDGDIAFPGSENVFDPTRAPSFEGDGVLPQRQTVGLTGKQYTVRLFATDTLSLTDQWHLNMGASWNFTRIDNSDTLRGDFGQRTLTAKDSYTRLNPSIGLTHTPNQNLTFYTSYSESSRAPTAIEVGCSNPANPCLLPAALADDPPLNQVVAKTYEFGGRGKLTDSLNWNAGVYHATNHDDIQFVASNTLNGAGYFKNIGRTKRQGLDFGLNGVADKFRWSASYSYIRATYDSDVEFVSGSNSSGLPTEGKITAKNGDSLPVIPSHQVKLRGQYEVTPAWNVGANVIGYSSQYVIGNENNAHRANSVDCAGGDECATGKGKISGYFIVNLDTQYDFGNGWRMFAKATNIFDREYNLSGRLAESLFDAAGTLQGEDIKVLSVLPGAPRAAWLGFRYNFAAKKSVSSIDVD